MAALRYDAATAGLVTGFKYHDRLAAGRVLGQLLLAAVRSHYADQPLPTLLLPVPLHASRLRERGYNQSLVLARDLGRALQLPVMATALQRQRATAPQQGLDAAQRRCNLRGAFVLRDPDTLRHSARIAVIDDVVTTMSTVGEIARVLQQACEPPPQIHVWCVARA